MTNILLVGYGRMGTALAKTWLTLENIEITVVSPELFCEQNIHKTVSSIQNDYCPDIIVFAVKPQVMDVVLHDYKTFCNQETLIISIAAGYTLAKIKSVLPGKVVRVMPNLPITVGCGVYGIFPDDQCNSVDRELINKLFSPSGQILWLSCEDEVDRITAISGSGPAYFYLFTEMIQQAAINIGFNPDQARILAESTFIGAAELMKEMRLSPSILRDQVTSPGGTTAAAIQSFINNGIEEIASQAVKAAYNRAKELS